MEVLILKNGVVFEFAVVHAFNQNFSLWGVGLTLELYIICECF